MSRVRSPGPWQGVPAQGEQGKIGPEGVQGEQGKLGPEGAQGEQGKLGPQGEQGKIGPEGAQGEQGKLGPEGAQGEQGKIGPEGAQGEQGKLGPEGAQGEQGKLGPQGEQGKIGPEGVQGEQGKLGPEGAQGEQGKIGPEGAQGEQGKLGPEGAQGEQGKIGPEGVQGEQGKLGPEGAQGEQGKLGPQGEQGKIGPEGAQGEQGKLGSQGEQGKIGPEGPKGDTGEAGPGENLLCFSTDQTIGTQGKYMGLGQQGGDHDSVSVVIPFGAGSLVNRIVVKVSQGNTARDGTAWLYHDEHALAEASDLGHRYSQECVLVGGVGAGGVANDNASVCITKPRLYTGGDYTDAGECPSYDRTLDAWQNPTWGDCTAPGVWEPEPLTAFDSLSVKQVTGGGSFEGSTACTLITRGTGGFGDGVAAVFVPDVRKPKNPLKK